MGNDTQGAAKNPLGVARAKGCRQPFPERVYTGAHACEQSISSRMDDERRAFLANVRTSFC